MIQYLPLIGKIIDKAFPDPAAKAEAKIKLIEMEQAGEFKDIEAALERDIAQIALNTEEAKSSSLFKSGWRPFIGWTCVVGFAYIVLNPLLSWAAVAAGLPPIPSISVDLFMPVLLGMLGLGGMRSFERYKGVIPRGK